MPKGQYARTGYPRKLDADCRRRLGEIDTEIGKLRDAEKDLARQRKELDEERAHVKSLRATLV